MYCCVDLIILVSCCKVFELLLCLFLMLDIVFCFFLDISFVGLFVFVVVLKLVFDDGVEICIEDIIGRLGVE